MYSSKAILGILSLCFFTTLWTGCKKPTPVEESWILQEYNLGSFIHKPIDLLQIGSDFLILASVQEYCNNCTGDTKIALVRTDSAGNELWSITHGETERGLLPARARLTQNNDVIVGYTKTFTKTAGWNKAGLAKFNLDDGSLVEDYIHNENSPYNDWLYDFMLLTDGSLVFTGKTGQVDTLKPEYHTYQTEDVSDILTVKLDPSYNSIWWRVYGFTNADWGTAITAISDHSYLITGTTQLRDGTGVHSDFIAVEYRATSGNLLNQDNFGGDNQDYELTSLYPDPEMGMFIMAGSGSDGMAYAGAIDEDMHSPENPSQNVNLKSFATGTPKDIECLPGDGHLLALQDYSGFKIVHINENYELLWYRAFGEPLEFEYVGGIVPSGSFTSNIYNIGGCYMSASVRDGESLVLGYTEVGAE